ncbi:MAG TPA: anthrone oxygenase family protein [Phototrophicaceae bacterium]|nr:anthrone oxygenase family protein [Phototrophicaceae bacterium]
MNLIPVLLALATLTSGIFTGLIFTMLDVMQPILNQQSGAEYTALMQNIISSGRRSRVVLVSLLGTILIALAALVLMVSQNQIKLAFWLTLAGWLAFVVGALGISRFAAEPLYDVIMGWKPSAPPADWPQYRQRWYQLNLMRGTGALAAFVLFLVALLVR